MALPAAHAADNSITLDTPIGGWREGSGKGAHFMQTVRYPASSVNVAPDQADTALIRGRISATPKAKLDNTPGTVIINGVNMPLKIQREGHFERPFSFPSGSNSVEVRSADGQQRRRVQFYNQGQGETPAKLRILLSWDSDNTDVDLHLITPDGEHVWYGKRSVANGASLDVDVTTGYGPEIIATATPLKGTYLVYLNYYGGGYGYDEEENVKPAQDLTIAQVSIITEEGTVNEKQETFFAPLRTPGELTLIKRFSYP